MIVISNENIRPFDCDGCLIYANAPGTETMPPVMVVDPVEYKLLTLKYNPNMVRLLKEEHQRGSYVIVWSRGGYQWAKNVVLALGLELYVDLVISKPAVYFDDTPVEDWLKDRVYLDPNTVYKR